jgi:hypothetical protein
VVDILNQRPRKRFGFRSPEEVFQNATLNNEGVAFITWIRLGLKVHPNKIVLKSIDDGIPFLGQIIKPHRCYIGNRTKNNFYQAIQEINKIMAVVPEFSWQQLCEIRTTLNSYLGYMQHANSFKLRKVMLGKLIKRFYDFYFVEKKLDKVIINEDFWQWHFSPSYRFIN